MPDQAAPSPALDTPASLKLLLEAVVDYAGMFPPAALPLDAAVENYARYLAMPDAWMLGRFVCPAARLDDLLPHAARFTPASPCRITLLASGGSSPGAFTAALAEDLNHAARLEARSEGAFRIDAAEVKWPPGLLPCTGWDAADFLRSVAAVIETSALQLSALYFELPVPIASLGDLLASVAAFNREASQAPRFGAKMRCGGTEASAFPSAEQVAAFIRVCTKARVAFKATAGLHHPLPHYDTATGARMHGFLNVLAATVLAREHTLPEAELMEILETTDSGRFSFEADGLRWNGHSASLEAIRQARTDGMVSFGSCSFEEPREDLRDLGLLS